MTVSNRTIFFPGLRCCWGLLLFLLSLGYSLPLSAQPTLSWARNFGGSTLNFGHSVVPDDSGNVIVLGQLQGTADFDPGPGYFPLTAVGVRDIFWCKLDAAGNFLWAKAIGGPDSDHGVSAVMDDGDIITAGRFKYTVDFDPGPGTLTYTTAATLGELFVMRMDAMGNLVWARQFPTATNCQGQSVRTDTAGNILVTGFCSGTIDFDPGPGTYSLTTSGSDAFVLKLDAGGNFIWARLLGGSNMDQGRALTTDLAGNVYVCGLYRATADFDPGPGTYSLTSMFGTPDMFVCKLNAAGNFVWAKGIGSNHSDFCGAIVADDRGNIYYGGHYRAPSMDVDPGPGIYTLTSGGLVGQVDCYVSKLDSAGNFLWAGGMGSSGDDAVETLALNAAGNVLIGGYFHATVDFDPGLGTYLLSAAGLNEGFIASWDSTGQFLWAGSIAGTDDEYVRAIGLGPDGIYCTGSFKGTADFDPWTGVDTLTAIGPQDAFVLKLGVCTSGSTDTTLFVTGCDTYTAPDRQVYTATGTYTVTIPNYLGCDSILTIHLTLRHSTASSLTAIVCDSFIAPDGQMYSQSGNYTALLPNSAGCDSMISIVLTVNPRDSSDVYPIACNSYRAPDGQMYFQSGNYTATVPNSFGCDSVISIYLTVQTLHVTVTNNGSTLMAHPGGASYQWVDCNAGMVALPGATGQNFSPAVSGSYAVIVSDGPCADTSGCEAVTVVGNVAAQPLGWQLHPNPVRETLTVRVPEAGLLRIMDMDGKVFLEVEVDAGESQVRMDGLSAGVYGFSFVCPGGFWSARVMIVR